MPPLSFRGNFDTGDFECYIKNELSDKERILMVQQFPQMNQKSELFESSFNIYLQKTLEAIYKAGYESALEKVDWELVKIKQGLS